MKQTHIDYNTKLVIRMATREDSGTYILTAENINGKDTAYAEVIVLGYYLNKKNKIKRKFTTLIIICY